MPHDHAHTHAPTAQGRHLHAAAPVLPDAPALPASLMRLSVAARLAAVAGALVLLWLAVLLALR